MLSVLEQNYYCRPTFNEYFWKHCLPPHSEVGVIPAGVGVVCMVRNPIEWNRSLFRFWHARRKELCPSSSISKFIREPLIVYDNSKGLADLHYHFSSPIDYWNKYYYAWAFWKNIRDQLVHVRLEDFESKTESVLKEIEAKFSLQRKTAWRPILPANRVGPFVKEHTDGVPIELSASDKDFIDLHCLADLKNFFNYCDLL